MRGEQVLSLPTLYPSSATNYLLQVKSNQPTLLQEIEDSFPKTGKGCTLHKEEDLGHGRIETRQIKSLVLTSQMLEDSYVFKA